MAETVNNYGEKQKSNTAKRKGKLKPPWKPGQSGNPKGRPKSGNSLAEIIREIGEEKIKVKTDNYSMKVLLAKRMWNEAVNGNMAAAVWIRDTGYGKPIQPLGGEDLAVFQVIRASGATEEG